MAATEAMTNVFPAGEPHYPLGPEAMFRGPPALEGPIEGVARRGRLSVRVGVVPDPREAGWDAVFGPAIARSSPTELQACSGFPSLFAAVHPEGHGYQNWLGWIQLVNERDLNGLSAQAEHDPIWFLQGKDVPYAAVGYAPSFFDAPARADRRPILWEADLFLCTVPFVSPEVGHPVSTVEPLAGLRWGFRIDAPGAEPTMLIPRWTGDWAWTSWLAVLRARFPRWQFAERTESVTWGTSRTG